MISFATEFPVKPIADRGVFVAMIISWLRGIPYSIVMDSPKDADLGGDTAHIKAASGEELRLREFSRDGRLEALGFRHDHPDAEGRLWRTETVLRRAISSDGQDLVRLRTQCIAQKPGARLDSPRKPFLIKAMLNDHWGGIDSKLSVSDQPHWLKEEQTALDLARFITRGEATQYLPVIYVSAIGASEWLLSQRSIEKLAYDVGGIAHVVVEPNRSFSFQLRDLTGAANAYGGTIAIAIPGRGIVRRFFLGLRLVDMEDLHSAVRTAVIGIRSQMPAEGWDWTELQEQALRRQRERDKNRLGEQETIDIYQAEIDNLKDRIDQLEAQIAAHASDEASDVDEGLLPANFVKKHVREIYPGEISDRIRLAVKECVAASDKINLDRRSKAVFDALAPHLPVSPALSELIGDLKRTTKDPRRVASELTSLLGRHGYREKADNKHIRLQAKDGYGGLDTITVPKTPSDGRGLVNLRKQVERTLGLGKLSD